VKINANSIRPGNILEHKNRLWVVAKIAHTQPGKGGAYVQVEMKDIKEGTKLNERFRSSEDVERAHLEERDYQYLFTEGDQLTLMDVETYEQIQINTEVVGEPIAFLQDQMMVTVISHEATPVSIELPENVTLEVVEADAVVKGQTAASSNKPAVLENGVRIMVPPFIKAGDKVVVNTAEAVYVERVKS
jgi:elongation factor P